MGSVGAAEAPLHVLPDQLVFKGGSWWIAGHGSFLRKPIVVDPWRCVKRYNRPRPSLLQGVMPSNQGEERMDDLIAILIAVVFFVVFYLFVRARERREREPGISLFGGETHEPDGQPARPAVPPPSDERRQ